MVQAKHPRSALGSHALRESILERCLYVWVDSTKQIAAILLAHVDDFSSRDV